MSTPRTLAILAMLLPAGAYAWGAKASPPPAPDGVFEAEAVVIVRLASGWNYTVVDAFKGDLKPGDEVTGLPLSFRTVRGVDAGGGVIVAQVVTVDATASSRILMFLLKDRKGAGWHLTHESAYEIADDPSQIEIIRKAARDAMAVYDDWQKAVAIKDPKERVKALWPLLDRETCQTCPLACLTRTVDELAKLGTVAGDYAAERFDALAGSFAGLPTKIWILPHLGQMGGEKLHAAVLKFIQSQWKTFDSVAPHERLTGKWWTKMPPPDLGRFREANTNLMGGLVGLGGFKDSADLPLIREIARGAAERAGGAGICDAALQAMAQIPAEENAATVQHLVDNGGLTVVGIAYTLGAKKYPGGVPLLAGLLRPELQSKERTIVRGSLKVIVGEDLGPDPKPWLDWYEKQKTPATAPATHPSFG